MTILITKRSYQPCILSQYVNILSHVLYTISFEVHCSSCIRCWPLFMVSSYQQYQRKGKKHERTPLKYKRNKQIIFHFAKIKNIPKCTKLVGVYKKKKQNRKIMNMRNIFVYMNFYCIFTLGTF